MRIYFSQIFWGLLLVILNISINGFDLLVDGVGYFIIAAGCRGLSSQSSKFVTARTLCFVLAILWLISFAVRGDIALAYEQATMIVSCTMIWKLLGGIEDFALLRQRPDLAKKAAHRRVAYVVIMIGTSLLSLVMHGSGNSELLAIILVLAKLILVVMILHLIHRVKVEIAI